MARVVIDVDPDLLREQKGSLQTLNNWDEEVMAHIEGILCMIDTIQDYMVDKLGMDENEIFDL